MALSLQHRQLRGSAWVRWVLCVLLALPVVSAHAEAPGAFVGDGQRISTGVGYTCAIDVEGRLKCWGTSLLGSTPEGRYVSVAAGDSESCAVRSDGEAVCWSRQQSTVTTPPAGPWRSLAVGWREACGLRPDGQLECWGEQGVAARIPASARFLAVSMSYMNVCAIRIDGTLQCWNRNNSADFAVPAGGRFSRVDVSDGLICAVRTDGELLCWGTGLHGSKDAPEEGDFVDVSVGEYYGCGLREDAAVACWGSQRATAGFEPIQSPQGEFTDIDSGYYGTCGRTPNGTVRCWGNGLPWASLDRQGPPLAGIAVGGGEVCVLDADGEPHCAGSVPALQPVPDRYSQLSLGNASGCGIKHDGNAACWGVSLGPTPTARMSQLSVGEAHACGVQADGSLVCWGDNSSGQTHAPPGRYLTVLAGDRYSCAITIGETVSCWGEGPIVSGVAVGNGFRTLHASKGLICASSSEPGRTRCWGGDGGAWLEQVNRIWYPTMAVGEYFVCWLQGGDVLCYGDYTRIVPNFPSGDFIAIAADGNRACAIDRAGQLICRGGQPFKRGFDTLRTGTGSVATGTAHTCSAAGNGRIECWGDNALDQREAPQIRTRALAASGDQTCAIVGDSTLQCWGDVSRGVGLPLPGVAVRDMDVGQYTGCAVRAHGGAACWGWNVNGQGTPPAGVFRRVATGLNHSCGIRDDNTLICWGYGADGQAAAPAGEFIALDVGERHSCAIAADGALHCWGMNGEGQSAPPADGRATYRALSSGAFHNCAIRSDGTLLCWGRNDHGQSAPPPGRFASVSAGVTHSCAVRDDGTRVCWGNNDSGQSPSLAIGPDALPRGEREQPYEARLAATGSSGYTPRAVEFRVVSGTLPSGIELDADGLLHGRPQADGASDVVLEARGVDGFSAQRAYRIQIGVPRDTAPPVLELVATGPLGDDSWYVGDVDIRWLSEGQQSGIDYMSGCESFVLTQDTVYRFLQCTVGTRGGAARAVSRTLKRDATPPRIREWLNPEAPNVEGWFRTPVTVFYDCLDVTSGVVGDCPQNAALSTEGVHTFPIQSVRDHAGNIATTPNTPIRIDMTRPELTATMPPAQLPVGATHDFQLSASDALSGVLSLGCTPIDTATVGTRQAVCQAIDRAGNEAVVSAAYEVVVAKHRGRLRPASPAQRRDGIPAKAKAVRLH